MGQDRSSDEAFDGLARYSNDFTLEHHDDDELAAALADQVAQYTSTLPVVRPSTFGGAQLPSLSDAVDFDSSSEDHVLGYDTMNAGVHDNVESTPEVVQPASEELWEAFPLQEAWTGSSEEEAVQVPPQPTPLPEQFEPWQPEPARTEAFASTPEPESPHEPQFAREPEFSRATELPREPEWPHEPEMPREPEVPREAEHPAGVFVLEMPRDAAFGPTSWKRAEPPAVPETAVVDDATRASPVPPPQTDSTGSATPIEHNLLTAPPPVRGTATVPPPGSALPDRPRRRSLDDADLATVVEKEAARTGSSSGAIEELETQMMLRADELHEFNVWERSMKAIGTPEALAAIEDARQSFSAVLPWAGSPPRMNQPDAFSPPPLREPPLWRDLSTAEPAPADSARADFDDADFDDADWAWPPQLVEAHAAAEALRPISTVFPVAPFPVPLEHRNPPAPVEIKPAAVRVFDVEESEGEPTALEHRAGRAAQLFWLWFATNSSALSIMFGAVLFGFGMSVRQTVLAVLAGVVLSFLPLALGSLAGKWSGQPTMIVSRAAFGVFGNVGPAALALVTRLFWGAALLSLFAVGAAQVLSKASMLGAWGEFRVTVIAVTGAFLVALLLAFFGHALITRVFLALSILSGVLIVGVVVLTLPLLDLDRALAVPDGNWANVLGGAVLIFSFLGLAWANSGADVARYQRSNASGAASMVWASLGAGIAPLVLISYGALLVASGDELGIADDPLAALTALLPAWYPAPLIAALGLSLVCAVALAIYSGAFAVQSTGLRLRRPAAVLVVGIGVAAFALFFTFVVGDLWPVLRDVATTLAVPVAAWVGIFALDLMLRSRRFDGEALLNPDGIYGRVNWANIAALVVATVVGFGFTTAELAGLEWQGFLLPVIGVPVDSAIGSSDFGVLVALAIASLAPLAFGVARIRRQESTTG